MTNCADNYNCKRDISLKLQSQTYTDNCNVYEIKQIYSIMNSDLRTIYNFQAILEVIPSKNITIANIDILPKFNIRTRSINDSRRYTITELPQLTQNCCTTLEAIITLTTNCPIDCSEVITSLSIQQNAIIVASLISTSTIKLIDASTPKGNAPYVAAFTGNALERNVGLL